MRLQPTQALLSAVLLASLLARNLPAQTTTSGGLTGVVTDPSGAVVSNAIVTIKDTAKGTSQATKTDREGGYRFFFLSPGRFTWTVAQIGFRAETRGVNVPPGPPVSVNVHSRYSEDNGTVTVTEEATLVHAENGDVSTTVGRSKSPKSRIRATTSRIWCKPLPAL